jgi:hypothetical protein
MQGPAIYGYDRGGRASRTHYMMMCRHQMQMQVIIDHLGITYRTCVVADELVRGAIMACLRYIYKANLSLSSLASSLSSSILRNLV